MQRIAVIASLKPGMGTRARRLIEHGPPFDPETLDLVRHTVYVSEDQAVFVFEGARVEALIHAAEQSAGQAALAAWEPVLEGVPHICEQVYQWERNEDPVWAGTWGE
jgi:hypothetical protein